MKDEWAIAYTSEYSVAVWTGYTDTGIENGYYITQDVLNQAIASHAARAMLDQISDNPTDIARPGHCSGKGEPRWRIYPL